MKLRLEFRLAGVAHKAELMRRGAGNAEPIKTKIEEAIQMAVRSQSRDWRWLMLAIAVVVVLLDRVTKLWIVAHVPSGHAIVVIPNVFRLTHVLNTGAAFSMFESSPSPTLVRNLLVGFSIAAVVVVLVLLWKMGRHVSLTSIALALILGGALGNLYDRVRFSYVVDFLEVHIVHYHWPDFNVADSAIVVGACLLLLDMLRPQPRKDDVAA